MENLSYNSFGDEPVVRKREENGQENKSPLEEGASPPPEEGKQVELQRSIGFFSACSIIIGTVIGSGIFVTPTGILVNTGSVGLTLIIWTLCGLVSLLGALSFSELSCIIPDFGGPYIWFMEALAPERKTRRSWWRQVIPFLYQFQTVCLGRPLGLAVQSLGFGTYVVKLGFLNCSDQHSDGESAIVWISLCFIWASCFMNCFSISLTTRMIGLFCILKIMALLLIILGGIVQLSSGEMGSLSTGFEGTVFGFNNISQALYGGLFSYMAWDKVTYITKEIKDPAKNVPRAMITSIILLTGIYTFTNVAYFSVLSKEEMLASPAVAETFGRKLAGLTGAIVMVVSVAASTAGSGNGGLFQGSRLAYVAGREGHMVDFLSYIHISRFTPCPAVVFTGLIATFYATSIGLFALISLHAFTNWIFIGMTFCCLLYFRYIGKEGPKGHFKVPIIIPILGFLFSLFLVVTPFIGNPNSEFIYVLLFQVVATLIYTLFVHFRITCPGFNHIRTFIQKILSVVPPEESAIVN